MIVVAIIGILAAIAVPSFQGFILKSRQSEAKTLLSSMYQVEQAHHAEFGYYQPQLSEAGFVFEGSYNYNAGFGDNASVESGATQPSGVNAATQNLRDVCLTSSKCSLASSGRGLGGNAKVMFGNSASHFKLEAAAAWSNTYDIWHVTNINKSPQNTGAPNW